MYKRNIYRDAPSCSDGPHLKSVAGEAQAQLPTHDHGLHGSPALAAHRPPHQRAVPLHQNLHTALVGGAPSAQTQLQAERPIHICSDPNRLEGIEATEEKSLSCQQAWVRLCVSERNHHLLEAHGRNVAAHRRVLLVAAAQRLFVELALGDGLLESRAAHLIHVDRAHS